MSEHVHYWEAVDGDGRHLDAFYSSCKQCYKLMEWAEIERRLNATERILNAAREGSVEAGIEVMKYVTEELGWAVEGK